MDFPGSFLVKNPPAMQVMQEMWVQSLGQEDPLEKEMATHSTIPVWEIPQMGVWQATVHGVARVGHNPATQPPPTLAFVYQCISVRILLLIK